MRHRKSTITLSRTSAQRKALARKMAIALFQHGSIRTTATRATFVRRFAEPLITKAKTDSVAVRRALYAELGNAAIVKTVLERAKGYQQRPGGYTRVTKLPLRRSGDASPLVQLELV